MQSIGIDSWPYRQPVNLHRFIFTVRSPLPFPDGFTYVGPVDALGSLLSDDDTNWVDIKIHHVKGGDIRELQVADAVAEVAGLKKREGNASYSQSDSLVSNCIVIEAITPDASEVPTQMKPTIAWTWREDPLMRAVYALRQLVRAERVAAEARTPLPAYEQIIQPVFASKAQGEQLLSGESPDARVIASLAPEWPTPQLVMLEHSNILLDDLSPRPECSQQDPLLNKWLVDLELDLPTVLWRERLADARQQFLTEGRYDLAVILSATATEVLIDGLLHMLWWEKSRSTSDVNASSVASAFDTSRDSVARMNKHLCALLGGNWSAADGPPQRWISKTWKLRHRCVHGGYYPTYEEAHEAMATSLEVATFIFDRIADKANEFPRVALQVMGEPGLRKRNLWNQRIRKFAETVARTEPNWRFAVRDFRADVEACRSLS